MVKHLFDAALAEDVKVRLLRLQPDNERQWGKMNPAQAAAHCAGALEMALGERDSPRLLFGRIAGRIIKPLVFKDDAPLRRNSPSTKNLIVHDTRDLGVEQRRLCALIDRFVTTGSKGACTVQPHAFFGRLTPEEWAILMYKHLDHHLRQFGV